MSLKLYVEWVNGVPSGFVPAAGDYSVFDGSGIFPVVAITVADLDRWDPASIRSVSVTAARRAGDTRTVAHDVNGIMQQLQWRGESYESALVKAKTISNELMIHADECDQASRDLESAASEVESVKSEWGRLQRMADHWGIVINTADGSLSWYTPADPEDAAEMERRADLVEREINDLVRRADAIDERLSAAVEDAISDMADALGTDHIEDSADARRTVEEALAGNQDSATQVQSVLDSIRPDQVAGTEPLTPLQSQVLSQMQAQQHGMSVPELTAAEQRLGDGKGIMADSWQLMSNPDMHFAKTELTPGALDNPDNITGGGFGQLPTSVQGVLTSKGMSQLGEMTQVTNIVKDGNGNFRHGTELNRSMLNKATEMMSSETFHGTPVGGRGPATIVNDGMPVALDVLATAGQDRQAVHDIVNDSNYAERFMQGSLTNEWSDDGRAVSDMFSWTGDVGNGPDARLAAETASAYGGWVGRLEDQLMNLPGNQTLGEVNPEAVQGLAHGLAPYIPDIADLSEGTHGGFDLADGDGASDDGSLPIAKGIFSVLSTDNEASDYFNGAAAREIAQSQLDYANDFKEGVDPTANNRRLADSMTLQGLVDSGTYNAAAASESNGDLREAAAYQAKKSAFEFGLAGADAAGLPGTDLISKTFTEALIGDPPAAGSAASNNLPNLDIGSAENQVLNALSQSGVEIHGVPDDLWAPTDPDSPEAPRRIRTFEEYTAFLELGEKKPASASLYDDMIKAAIVDTMGEPVVTGIDLQMTSRYNAVTENTDPP